MKQDGNAKVVKQYEVAADVKQLMRLLLPWYRQDDR